MRTRQRVNENIKKNTPSSNSIRAGSSPFLRKSQSLWEMLKPSKLRHISVIISEGFDERDWSPISHRRRRNSWNRGVCGLYWRVQILPDIFRFWCSHFKLSVYEVASMSDCTKYSPCYEHPRVGARGAHILAWKQKIRDYCKQKCNIVTLTQDRDRFRTELLYKFYFMRLLSLAISFLQCERYSILAPRALWRHFLILPRPGEISAGASGTW